MTQRVIGASNGGNHSSRVMPLPSEDLVLDLPVFTADENLSSLEDRHIERLTDPDFSRYVNPSRHLLPDLSIELPHFTATLPLSPLDDSYHQSAINLPEFNAYRECDDQGSERPLFIQPIFSLYRPPRQTESDFIDLPLPGFIPYSGPLSLSRSLPTLSPPFFRPFQAPEFRRILPEALRFFAFNEYSPPNPCPLDLLSLTEPEFVPYTPVLVRNSQKKHPKAPRYQVEYNPVMKQFDRLARLKSYNDILQEAIKLDSLGDLRMLRRRTLLKPRYIETLFDNIRHEIPSYLPRSSYFQILLDNDQEQIDFLAGCCFQLTITKELKELQGFSPSLLLREAEETDQQKILLQIKDCIYCFCSELLLEEKKAAQRFTRAQKNLKSLEEGLAHLETHINEEVEVVRMHLIREGVKVDFAPWEDRSPQESKIVKLEPGEAVENFDYESGLQAIQKQKPERYQLTDFTNAVIQLPEADPIQAVTKAKYFLALGRVYFNLPTITALKEAVAWIDQAIHLLEKDKDNPLYLECYELRGAVWYKIGQIEKPLSTHENALVRQRVDVASRDFRLALPLASHQEKNFVRLASSSMQESSLETTIQGLEESIQIDEDFAEARYRVFLKQFEKCRFDITKLLHSQFDPLRSVLPATIVKAFKDLLMKGAHSQGTFENPHQFQVSLSSGFVILQLTSDGIAFNKAGKDVLVEMLSKGIHRVKVLHQPKHKAYFAPFLSPEEMVTTIRSLCDYPQRLGEMEKAVQDFRQFELACLYKSTYRLAIDELTPTTVLSRLDPNLILKLVDFKIMIAEGYARLGGTLRANDLYAKALLYICRSLSDIDFLMTLKPDNRELQRRKLNLIIKRAAIYKRLCLWNSYACALEEAVGLGKAQNPRFVNPSLHYSLGVVYRELGRFKEAEDQFRIVEGLKKNRHAEKARVQREAFSYEDDKPAQKKLELLEKCIKIYEKLGLWNSYARAIQEIIKLNKIKNPRQFNASLHDLLGTTYRKLGRLKEAEEQFALVEENAQDLHFVGKARMEREAIKKDPPPEAEDTEVIKRFQDSNIREECLQILEENAKTNILGEPYQRVAIWDHFASKVKNATTIQQLCEVVLASILPSAEVKSENLLRIARVSNVRLAELTDLDQFKDFLLDAIRAYKAKEAELQDKVIAAHVAAKERVAQAEAFQAFKKNLMVQLKNGNLIRPGSASRKKISDLVVDIEWHPEDSQFVLDALGAIIEKDHIPANLVLQKDDITEIKDHLESVLDLNVRLMPIQQNVLQINGRNIFLSEILSQIKTTCSGKKVQDIHIVGVNIYVDVNLTFHGVNFAFGGEYIQAIKDKDGQLLTIDLSGENGTNAPLVSVPKAADARHHGESGAPGEDGNDGQGGQPGGDFCVVADTIVGFDPGVIREVNLHGGSGGTGSDGGAGGQGFKGVAGENARTDVRKGDPADSDWGHIDMRRGGKATPGSDGGRGGHAGLGGKPGVPGHFLMEKGAEKIQGLIKKEPGSQGSDGNFGAGGKGGEGQPDGLHHVIVKGGGWIFSSSKSKSGYELSCERKDRDIDNWHDNITVEQMKNRNQGKSKTRGMSAEEQTRSRNEQKKNDLKRQLFDSSRSKYIHTEGSAGKGYAFDAVTNRLAVARDTEAVVSEQLAVKQRKMKDIDTLLQTTATLLSQTQTQQKAEAQHSRVATFSKKKKAVDQKREILSLLKNPAADLENCLPFHKYSPVPRQNTREIHEVEYAIHAVNMTQGKHMPTIARLINVLMAYSRDSACDQGKLIHLWNRVAQIIKEASLKQASQGFDQLWQALDCVEPVQKAIKAKKTAVDLFDKVIQDEQEKIREAYQKKIHELQIKGAILRFFKTDRLFYQLLIKHFDHDEKVKKERWFEQRLHLKIIEIVERVTTLESSSIDMTVYSDYARTLRESMILKCHPPTFPSRVIEAEVSEQQKLIRGNLKTMRQHQDWILKYLAELVEAKVIPLAEDVAIESLYKVCSQKWANAPSLEPPQASEDGRDVKPPLPKSKRTTCIDKVAQDHWSPRKRALLETHVKQLIDLNLGEEYLDHLQELYTGSDAEAIAEIFILHVMRYQRLTRWKALLGKLQSERSSDIYALRERFCKIDNPKDEALHKKLQAFLHDKHVALTKSSCKAYFSQRKDVEKVELFLDEFIEKASKLDLFRQIVPGVDFLGIVHGVVENRKQEIARKFDLLSVQLFITDLLRQSKDIQSSQSHRSLSEIVIDLLAQSEDLFNPFGTQDLKRMLIQEVQSKADKINSDLDILDVGGSLASSVAEKCQSSRSGASFKLTDLNLFDEVLRKSIDSDLSDANLRSKELLVRRLNRSIARKDFEAIGANLFLLFHLDLSFEEGVGVLDKLEALAEEDPILEGCLTLMQKRVVLQKKTFDLQWKAALKRAQTFDQFLKQIDKGCVHSIEKILFEVGDLANYLSPIEKITILNKVIDILSKEGCFSSLHSLKHLKIKVLKKVGVIPSAFDREKQAYNEAFEAAFSELDGDRKQLPALFLDIAAAHTCNPDLLRPCIIAVNHLDWDPDNLVHLYEWVRAFEPQEADVNLHQECLKSVRQLLIGKLKNRCQTHLERQKTLARQLMRKQADVVGKMGSVITNTSVFSPDHQIAKFQLWLKMLDLHYDTEANGDLDGEKRQAHYEAAYACFLEKMKLQDTQKGIDEFNEWLGAEYNKLKSATADLTILDALAGPQGRAFLQLNRLFWRGVVTYPQALERLKEKELSEEVAAALKLKLDDSMIHEEFSKIKALMEEEQKKYEEDLANWINHLADRIISAEEIQYPDEEMLIQAIERRKIPTYLVSPPERREDKKIILEEWVHILANKTNFSIEDQAFLQKGLSEVEAYLKELEERIQDEEIDAEDDVQLKFLKQIFERSIHPEFLERIRKLELELINCHDKKEQEKIDRIKGFIDLVADHKRNDLKTSPHMQDIQRTKYLDKLEATIQASALLIGEEILFPLLEELSELWRKDHENLTEESLTQFFWVFPRLNNPQIVFDVIKTKLPENWAMVLLEIHCYEVMAPSLEQLVAHLPRVDFSHLNDVQKDEALKGILENNKKRADEALLAFRETLNTLKESTLRDDEKELLLRLLAERLSLLNQGELQFSIEEFTFLISKYLADPVVLRKISAELSKKHSVIANTLFAPSYQALKYSLTLAWIEAMLGDVVQQIGKTDSQKIYDSLFQIETSKKEEMMRRVVDSLKGGLMTPAVAESIAHFADGTWELDDVTLKYLKERTESGEWYSAIEEYSKQVRSKPRTLEALVEIMAKDKTGINHSVEGLISGDNPKLVQVVQQIQQKFNGEICGWTGEQILEWAKNSKSEAFLKGEERLIEGIAVVSRAYQLFHPKKYTLRETQMMAIWLMLRSDDQVAKGRICQMFTGEGKSITFASLAILKAMTRSYVDVVTTSHVLAKRDAEEFENLFKMFDLTVANNCDQECEADEEIRKTRYFRDKKRVDIVYGDVGAFERDLLLTEFHGQEIIHSERMGPDRAVLIDEVDGLFLDNAGMVLYLSHNVDTLRFLERVFGQIWALANHPSFEQARAHDEKAIAEICKLIKEKIESDEIPLPLYEISNARYVEMKAIIYRKLPIWTRSALHAKALRVNDEYIIADQSYGKKKKKTVTVMDKGTGIEQYSLKWSNGLHQFLQFKHGLELTPESLKAVFLSNYFFFKRYGQHIYGLSGTLGSDTEQRYLQELYQVDLCKIPRFKGEKYIKYKDVVTSHADEWIEKIQESVERELKQKKRAVLVICDSVAEVMVLQEQLKKEYPLLHIYTSTTQTEEISFFAHDNPSLVAPGDLIIATNLAGRGTDLKTSPLLEDHGGLHVIMSYLPQNVRIQEQGFGRTARSGNEGSGELIVIDPHRRPITQLCRMRDMEEKQRLENIAIREVKKIEFENELLRGFVFNNERIEGFQDLLNWVKKELEHEEPFYREAQINSLKNRWAFWIDHMEEKITIVHAIGKDVVVTSFKEFQRGVRDDFGQGEHRLIKEPVELIKLGSEYRRLKMWTKAHDCYAAAAKDPHYKYALYYKAACQFLKAPTSSNEAKQEFKKEAKKAALAIRPEIAQLQTTLQSVAPIAEQTRLKQGAADYGNPYKARTEERIQIWSIFLTAIDEALGGTITEEAIKKSQYWDENRGPRVLRDLGTRYRADAKLSKKLAFHDDKVVYSNPKLGVNKEITIPKMFLPVLTRLRGIERITKQVLKTACEEVLLTRKKAKGALQCPQKVIYKFTAVPSSFKWPNGFPENVQFVLSTIIEELKLESFQSLEQMKEKLRLKKAESKLLVDERIDTDLLFRELEAKKLIGEDYELQLANVYLIEPPVTFESKRDLRLDDLKAGFTPSFSQLEEALQNALFNACRYRAEKDGRLVWSLKPSIHLSELSLPSHADEAVEMLWNIFEEQQVTKVPKIKLDKTIGHFKDQMEQIKDTVKGVFRGHPEAEKAVESIHNIIDSSVGMIYKLDDKKTTAKFADIIRKYYHDHQQHAPEGLGFFIELGLEVIADLIEKKDPPAWFEVLAVTVMGVVQMVAGVIIKAYLPIVGDLIGNALISSGMDDVMFAINSAITGEFSWADYGEHKVASLKRSIISSAISCGVSFGVDSAKMGVDKAWDVQKLSGVERMAQAGQIASTSSFNLGSHVAKEIGRQFISMGISQVASRGLEGMTRLIAGSYEKKVRENIESAVNEHWTAVVAPQAKALYDKLAGDSTAQTKIDGCIKTLIKSSTDGNFFDGAVRGSRQVLPQARNMIRDKGWGTFVSFAPDIANLGVSLARLNSLIKDNTYQLARDIRATNDRNTQATQAANFISEAAFNAQLEKMKKEYAEQLTQLFNGMLNSAVYAPLVSLGTKALVEAGSQIIPMTEQEAIAQSSETLAEILETQNNADEAFFDKAKRHWREANEEVVELTDAQLQQSPENCPESIDTLKKQYGSLLKVYKDKDGHLYVQRPTRSEYIQGIREGKASGDPEIAALAKVAHKNIAVINPDGKIKTFSVDSEGKVIVNERQDDNARDPSTIYMKFEPNPTTGIGHISLEGAVNASAPSFFEGNNCLYDAVGAQIGTSAADLRQDAASALQGEGFKRFYHDWSLSSEPKQFAGSTPYNLGMRVMAGLGAIGSLGEIGVGGALSAFTFATGVPTILVGGPIIIHGGDNFLANLKTIYTGEETDPYTTQFLQDTLGMSHTQAGLANCALEMVGTAGGGFLLTRMMLRQSAKAAASAGLKFNKSRVLQEGANEVREGTIMNRQTFEAELKKMATEIKPTTEGGPGMQYIIDTPNGKYSVRVMEAYKRHPTRAVFQKFQKDGRLQQVDYLTGQFPKANGLTGKARRNYDMERSHIVLE